MESGKVGRRKPQGTAVDKLAIWSGAKGFAPGQEQGLMQVTFAMVRLVREIVRIERR